jgi:hypothetical protein
LFANWAVLALVLSLAVGSTSWAKPADLPVENEVQCSGGADKISSGSITLGWDILSGGLTVKVQINKSDTEPPVNLDPLCPALVPAYLEQLLKYVGAALTNAERVQADAARTQKARALLETRLFEPVSVRIKNVPLQQAIRNLAHASGVRMALDHADLKAGGVDLNTPVSLALENTSLHTALGQLLNPLRLTYEIEQGMLKIKRMEPEGDNLSAAQRAARAKNEQAQRLFEIAESHRRSNDYAMARKLYQQVHLLTPTTLHGRVAIMRLIEVEERMRESFEEQSTSGHEDPEQVFRDMRDRSIPLGLVEISY